MDQNKIFSFNRKVLNFLSVYLNDYAKTIQNDDIKRITSLGFTKEYAFALLLATYDNLDIPSNSEDNLLFNEYYLKMVKQENEKKYLNNPYYKNIMVKNITHKNWTLKIDEYQAYEAFVRDDMIKYFDGKILPQIGFFDKKFAFPAIYENDRLWMSITPNEINTMEKDINDSFGNVLTLGLGMGYFSYMVSLKENVNKVTIIEKDKNVIELFEKNILPFFENKEKIEIINIDAFDFLDNCESFKYDYIFSDLWHDVSDGLPLYKKIKKYENKYQEKIWRYWIEKTLLCY